MGIAKIPSPGSRMSDFSLAPLPDLGSRPCPGLPFCPLTTRAPVLLRTLSVTTPFWFHGLDMLTYIQWERERVTFVFLGLACSM